MTGLHTSARMYFYHMYTYITSCKSTLKIEQIYKGRSGSRLSGAPQIVWSLASIVGNMQIATASSTAFVPHMYQAQDTCQSTQLSLLFPSRPSSPPLPSPLPFPLFPCLALPCLVLFKLSYSLRQQFKDAFLDGAGHREGAEEAEAGRHDHPTRPAVRQQGLCEQGRPAVHGAVRS